MTGTTAALPILKSISLVLTHAIGRIIMHHPSKFLFLFIVITTSCGTPSDKSIAEDSKEERNGSHTSPALFKLLSPTESGVDFENNIIEDQDYNYFKFQYTYNGGGVGIGDLNNDGLHDIYLVGNQVQDRLYLNKGDLHFEDITASSGIKDGGGFHFGVTMVDIDQDGDLDIYVSVSGHAKLDAERRNRLYINNGDLTFTESAAEWGLADSGHSIQSAFFDYDQDGDLDMYVTNHPTDFGQNLTERLKRMKTPAYAEMDRLYRNEGNQHFTDVTKEAGLVNYGHGLGLIIMDINEDGLDDIYVANDYQSTDFVYVNQGNGTFKNEVKKYFPHIPYYSMGVDVADLDNDGLMDINVVEMLPENFSRRILNMADLTEKNYYIFEDVGFHHQYMRNCLSYNTGQEFFSDRALMTGTEATDWSWATLLADYDNDGHQDILVTNGYLRDMQDKDYAKRLTALKSKGSKLKKSDFDAITVSTKIRNYLYRNEGDHAFKNIASTCGMDERSFSSGASYADLDQDGDLDLIINNVNLQLAPDPTFIYENVSEPSPSITVRFNGPVGNRNGEGCRAIVEDGGKRMVRELRSTRGYLSSVPPELHFGLGETKADRLTVIWPDGSFEVIESPASGAVIVCDHANAAGLYTDKAIASLFVTNPLPGFDFTHTDKVLNEFDREKQLPFRLGMQGPGACIGDVNGDGLDDIFITSSAGASDMLYLQGKDGFEVRKGPWSNYSGKEDVCAAFCDVDGDKDLDLYVGSGGIEFLANDPGYMDMLFLNDGHGNFSEDRSRLPKMSSSTSCVRFGDVDGDGDQDAFVGSRSIPMQYGAAPTSYLLINENGVFSSAATDLAPGIPALGMVSDATWFDMEGDGDLDLVVVGEWKSPVLFINEDGKLTADDLGVIPSMRGLWRTVRAADLDGNGIPELILGNCGTNIKYKATKEAPLQMYLGDLDANGNRDIMLAYAQGKYYHPDRSLTYLQEQFPFFIRKFPTYADYVGKNMDQIFGEGLAKAELKEVDYLESTILRLEDGKFHDQPLPYLAQVSSTNAILPHDVDGDGDLDLILAGNELYMPIQTGSLDGGIGCVLINDGKGKFESMHPRVAGLRLDGWVKGLSLVGYQGIPRMVAWRNDNVPLCYSFR